MDPNILVRAITISQNIAKNLQQKRQAIIRQRICFHPNYPVDINKKTFYGMYWNVFSITLEIESESVRHFEVCPYFLAIFSECQGFVGDGVKLHQNHSYGEKLICLLCLVCDRQMTVLLKG